MWVNACPNRFTPVKEIRYRVCPRAGVDGCGKCRLHRYFFFWDLSLVLSLYFFRTSFFVLIALPCSFVSAVQHNTNIHAPGWIRTLNPNKRSAADPCLRPLGYWDRQIRSPDRPARSKSLYRLSSPDPQE